MACRLINRPIDGKSVQSKTWNELYNIYQDENKADEAYAKLTSKPFLNWFGDWINDPSGKGVSKAVTEDGEPLVVYHGTQSNVDFDTFDLSKSSSGGVFFTDNRQYAEEVRHNTRIISPTYLNISNPITVDEIDNDVVYKNRNKGNDGIIGKDFGQDKGKTYVIFKPEQAKSINNRGMFDNETANIYFNKSGSLSSVMRQYGTVYWNGKNEEEIVMHPLQARRLVNDMNANTGFKFKTVIFNAESAVVRVDNSTEVKRTPVNENEKYLDAILTRMPEKFGIEYKIVTPEQAVRILAGQGFDRTVESVEPAFYDGKTVYLVSGKFKLTDAIHEYAHPFIDALKNDNPELYNKLYNDLINSPDGEIILNEVTELGYPKSQIDREVMVRAITARANATLTSMKSKSIVDKIFRYLKKLLRDVFGIKLSALSMNTTLEELATILISKEKVNIESARESTETQFNREPESEESDPELDEIISNQNISTKEQRETVETLVKMRRDVSLSEDNKFYEVIDNNGKLRQLTRTTDYLKGIEGPGGQLGYFGYDGPEEGVYNDNAQWGNQMDDILTAVLKGESLETAKARHLAGITSRESGEANLTTEVVEELYNIFTALKSEYPDAVLISQQILYNIEKGIAGTADIMIIHKDGSTDILDLKSSINPSDGSYIHTLSNGDTVETSYTKEWSGKSSKKNRHRAQLSVYTGLANSQGIFTNGQNKTIHILIESTAGSTVTKVRRESDKLHPPMTYILNLVNKDAQITDEESRRYNELNKILAKIKETFLKKKVEFASQGKEAASHAMKNIVDQIDTTNFGGAISIMVEETHNTLVGRDNWKGWFKIISDTVGKRDKKALATLADAKEQLELYLPVIKQMKDFYGRIKHVEKGELVPFDIDPESPIGKMKFLIDNINTYISHIDNEMPNIQAEILYPLIEPAIKNLAKEARAKREALTEYRRESEKRGYKEGTRAYKRRKKIEDRLEREYSQMYRRATLTKEEYAEMIREGNYGNINNVFDIYVNPAVSSSNEIVASVALATKEGFEEARLASLDMRYEATDAFEKFLESSNRKQDNVEEFNKGLYKRVKIFTGEFDSDGNPIFKEELHFVSNIDHSAYEEAKGAFMASVQKLQPEQRQQAIRRWYRANRTAKPKEDTTVTMPNGDIIVIQKGINSILEDKRKIMSKASYENWLKNSTKVINGVVTYTSPELTMPNPGTYSSTDIDSMSEPLLNYYNFLIGSYFKSQSKLPPMSQPGYRLPSIVKTDLDRFKERGGLGKLTKYKKESIASVQSEDIENVGVEGRSIPVLYAQKNMDVEDVSVDLISSVLMFEDAANLYKARAEIAPVADSILTTMKSQEPIRLTNSGELMISRFAKSIGLDVSKWERSMDDNKPAKLLAGFIDMQIYGKHKKQHLWKNIDLGKVGDSIMSYASMTQIAFKPILGAANWLNAGVMSQIEAHAGQFYSTTDWRKGLAKYNEHITDFMKDFTQPYDKSVIGMLFDRYDAIQGTSRNKFGRKVSQSTGKKLFDTSSFYFNMSQGEHHIQGSSFLAMLYANKAINEKGEEKPLIEAYEKSTDGKLKLKEGWTIDHLGSVSSDGLVVTNVRNRLHSINKSMHGVYNTFDKPIIEQHVAGRLLLMYRKFLVPGFKRRWQTYSANYESGEAREGYYITYWKTLMKDWKQAISYTLPFVKPSTVGLTPLEQMNLRRATMDFAMIALTALMVAILSSLRDGADDEDEKWLLGYPLYLTMRLQSELRYYSRFQDLYRSFRAPTASYSIVEKSFKLVNQMTNDVLTLSPERYQRDAGIAKKGDMKSIIYLYKLLGINGATVDPSEAIKILKLQTD